jgi:1-hydroxycarotenoid 3,4-desaturase
MNTHTNSNQINKPLHPHQSTNNKVVVVGAGIGGLVSALLLAHSGARVTVIEGQSQCGGKLRQLWPGSLGKNTNSNEYQGIDSGPTVLTMKWVFEEIFASIGANLESELKLTQLSVLARHAWSEDSGQDQLTLYADPLQSEDAVGRFAGSAELRRFKNFCKTAKSLYAALEGAIIRESSPSMRKLAMSLGPRGLALLAGIGPMKSLWDSLGSYFNDPRLQQLFARYATYCGSSPWSAPATLMLIAQVEMDGVWSVAGGMRSLAQTIERLCIEKGVQFKYETLCQRIELSNARVAAVQTNQDERIEANAVVFNGDIDALYSGLLGPQVQSKMLPTRDPKTERSLSALTWSMRCKVNEKRFNLDRHNVFFQNSYDKEFRDIFQTKRLPLTPTVYVCAQERGLGVRASNKQDSVSEESIFCLINAPASGDVYSFTNEELELCEKETFSLLSRCGLQLERDPQKTIQTLPLHFHQLFPATGGALYGQATHGWLQVFSRSQATTPVKGLFLAGGSVHPGPGLPMAAMSARLGAGAVMEHLGLTKR